MFRKYFDIRFSHKHCDFSSGCLPVKMASKTVMRPILENIDMYLAVADPGEGP